VCYCWTCVTIELLRPQGVLILCSGRKPCPLPCARLRALSSSSGTTGTTGTTAPAARQSFSPRAACADSDPATVLQGTCCFFCRQRPRDCSAGHVLLCADSGPRLFCRARAVCADSGPATVLQATCCFVPTAALALFCRSRATVADSVDPRLLLSPRASFADTGPATSPPRGRIFFFFSWCLSPAVHRFGAPF
jgi:hypothetical protein